MTRSWVSGGKSSESIDQLRQEISDLEVERDRLVESGKRKVFEWAVQMVNSRAQGHTNGSQDDERPNSEIEEIIAKFDFLTQSIMDKQVLLNEKVDEQTKLDSLG